MEALSPEVPDADVEDARAKVVKVPGAGVLRSSPAGAAVSYAGAEANLGSEVTRTEVARRCAISSGLLYGWRRQVLRSQVSVVTGSAG